MKNDRGLMDCLRDLQRDREYQAAVERSKRADEIMFLTYFLPSMCVLSVLAYLWGELVWNMIQEFDDFKVPGAISYLFCTLFLAVTCRKMGAIR